MAKIYPVDPALIRRGPASGCCPSSAATARGCATSRGSTTWDAAQGRLATTAYIAWALAESGYRGQAAAPRPQLPRGAPGVSSSRKPYSPRAVGRGRVAADRAVPAYGDPGARRPVASKRGNEAFVSARGATLFYARGRAADAQVTALAAMAFHRAKMTDRADRALQLRARRRRRQLVGDHPGNCARAPRRGGQRPRAAAVHRQAGGRGQRQDRGRPSTWPLPRAPSDWRSTST